LLAVAFGMTAVACKDKPAEPEADAASTATTASVAPQSSSPAASASASAGLGDGGAHARIVPRGHGPGAMLFVAAQRLPDLKDEQKAKIDTAQKRAHDPSDTSARDAMRTAGKEVHSELIVGVKAGKIDTAKLDAKYAAVEKALRALHENEAEALTSLHAALEPAQRKAVVAEVRAKQSAREERMAKRADRDHADAGADGGAKVNHGKRRLDRLTRDLALDAEQEKKVAAIAPKDEPKGGPDRAEAKKRLEALLTAFEKDSFDAKKLDAFDAKKARAPMEDDTKLLAQLVPILKPEQREKLASKMEHGGGPHGGRRPGGGGFDHSLVEVDDTVDDEE